MLNSQNSGTKRRKSPRRRTKAFIRFRVTDLSSGTPLMVERKAEVIDLSDDGLGILTDYPLQKGHIITITDKDHLMGLPDYGVVQWSEEEDDLYRAGIIYRKL